MWKLKNRDKTIQAGHDTEPFLNVKSTNLFQINIFRHPDLLHQQGVPYCIIILLKENKIFSIAIHQVEFSLP